MERIGGNSVVRKWRRKMNETLRYFLFYFYFFYLFILGQKDRSGFFRKKKERNVSECHVYSRGNIPCSAPVRHFHIFLKRGVINIWVVYLLYECPSE